MMDHEVSGWGMTTGKTIALTRWTFVGKGMSLLLNMLSSLLSLHPKSFHRTCYLVCLETQMLKC